MERKNSPKESRVWVPVLRADNWPDSVTIEDSSGKEHRTGAGPYCMFEDTKGVSRLGIGAVVLGQEGGVYRVRFRDGLAVLVAIEAETQWERAA